ncbi:MAG TPA: hypothetical protein VI854_06965 [Acidimicrobiia bacterium]|nr:hypothetical protein [Acidimicrobiia bacterium]
MATNSRMVITMTAASSSGLRPATDLDLLEGHRRHQGDEVVGADPGGRGALPDRHQLDGTGHHGPESIVGLAPPHQPLGVDHEHVHIALADGLLPGGDALVTMHAHFRLDGGAVILDRAGQLVRDGARQAHISRAHPAVERRGQDDRADDDQDHDGQRCLEGARAAPLPHLADGDQPALLQAGHAATARRNSSESVGGS